MQHALVHHNNGTYTEFVSYGHHKYDSTRYEFTTDLCVNTEYPPELIQVLNSNYAHWVLILSEEGALLVAYNANVSILAFGETANIIDWVRDVPNRTPFGPARFPHYRRLGSLFYVSPFLDYLYYRKYMSQLLGYEVMRPVQTTNGTPYWCRILYAE